MMNRPSQPTLSRPVPGYAPHLFFLAAVLGFYPSADPHVPYTPAGIRPAHTGRASRRLLDLNGHAFTSSSFLIGERAFLRGCRSTSSPTGIDILIGRIFSRLE